MKDNTQPLTHRDKMLAIPEGPYCYELLSVDRDPAVGYRMRTRTCPFWQRVPSAASQEDGYCQLLLEADTDAPFGDGLLWDQVKGCGINDKFNDEEDEHE